MGFDLTIRLDLEIDEKTGMPYVYYNNNGSLDKRPYDPMEFKIPEEYSKYIEQRGGQFHSYVKKFPEHSHKSWPRDFLQLYPDWETVKNDNYLKDEDYWTIDDHNKFKKFLEWMVSKSPVISLFEIHWSY
jgi:hypothetical protein